VNDWKRIDAENPETWPPENVKVLVGHSLRGTLQATRYGPEWVIPEDRHLTWYEIDAFDAWMPIPVYNPNEAVIEEVCDSYGEMSIRCSCGKYIDQRTAYVADGDTVTCPSCKLVHTIRIGLETK